MGFVIGQTPLWVERPVLLDPGTQLGVKADINVLLGRMLENVNVIHDRFVQIARSSWVWSLPLSLATTDGIAFAFFSSGY